ncbi:hypothetical protein [Nonomuraea sediminis]|uniref:hypothetical protein n=1 Tax=Nonomuraea sediminis TaxID=2835864 RepID=UPI001BDCF22F|nr:hypothetical protein [Nonomuraea sediminis]
MRVPLALLCLVAVSCSQTRYHVALPPPSASPEVVAMVYLRALDAHDASTARSLSTSRHQSMTDMWLRDTDKVSDIKILGTRKDETVSGDRMVDAIAVATEFYHEGGDISFPDGVHPWDYLMIHDAETGRWLINDEGLG